MTGVRRSNQNSPSRAGPEPFHGGQPPPFLTKTYDLVDEPSSDPIVSWGPDGTSFVVWKPPEFARDLLPRHFKHNNFSSFVRQLNTYGFRKVDPDKWEFANEYFIKGRKELLKEIHRRKPTQTTPPGNQSAPVASTGQGAIELGNFGGFHDEFDSLKRDKNVLMLEIVRLRQAQQSTEHKMRDLQNRLEATEQRQQTILNFFASALKNPNILQRLFSSMASGGVQRIGAGPSLGAGSGRKKRRARGESDDNSDNQSGLDNFAEENHQQLVQYTPNQNGDFTELLLQQLNTLTASQEPPDINSSFDALQLGGNEANNSMLTIHDQTNLPTVQGLESMMPTMNPSLVTTSVQPFFPGYSASPMAPTYITPTHVVRAPPATTPLTSTMTAMPEIIVDQAAPLIPNSFMVVPDTTMAVPLSTQGLPLATVGTPCDTPPLANVPIHIDNNPTVSSPAEDDMDIPLELMHQLQHAGSEELLLPDDIKDDSFKDEIWNHIFGQGPSGELLIQPTDGLDVTDLMPPAVKQEGSF